jgi:hypothetical protein
MTVSLIRVATVPKKSSDWPRIARICWVIYRNLVVTYTSFVIYVYGIVPSDNRQAKNVYVHGAITNIN